MKFKHVEQLIKGKRSGANVGSRAVGHRLTQEERKLFERALKVKFLVVDVRMRDNLKNVWEKTCEAKDWPCVILTKNMQENSGNITRDGVELYSGNVADAKAHVKTLAD